MQIPLAPQRFVAGFLLPLRGVGLLVAHREVRRWALLIAAVTAVLLLAIPITAVLFLGDLLSLVWERPEGAWLIGWFAVAFVLFSLIVVGGVVAVPAILTAPLADPLVAATERALGAPGPAESGILRVAKESLDAVVKAFLRVALLLLGHALLLLLWLLPGVGQSIWAPLSLLWSLVWLAFEYLDLPANRFGYSFREIVGIIRQNLPESLGFALCTYFILWVPVVNAFFIPLGVIGATLLFVELRASGRMVPSREEMRLVMKVGSPR